MPDTTQPADPHADPVADFLADVKMQAEDHHLVLGADALRLVAALEAVLALHEYTDERGRGVCSSCLDAYGEHEEWPCANYQAISAALLGSEPAPAGEEEEEEASRG